MSGNSERPRNMQDVFEERILKKIREILNKPLRMRVGRDVNLPTVEKEYWVRYQEDGKYEWEQ